MKYALLALSMGAAVTKNMVSRAGKAAFGSGRGMLRANMATAALGLVVFGVAGLNFSFFSADILLLAALYGLLTLLSQTLHIIAVRTGPVSVCSLIYASGFRRDGGDGRRGRAAKAVPSGASRGGYERIPLCGVRSDAAHIAGALSRLP